VRWYRVTVEPVDVSRRQVLAKGGALALVLGVVGCGSGTEDDGPDVDDTEPNGSDDTEPDDTDDTEPDGNDDDTTTSTEPSDF
jgi:hypothetical protein